MPEISVLLPLVAMLMAASAFAGVLAGMLGVGGGIVYVPAFFLVFERLGYASDWLMQICVASSLTAIIFTSIRSLAAHHKRGAVDWTILRSWAPGIAIGAVLGVLVAARLSSVTLQIVFGIVAFLVGIYLLLGRQDWRLGAGMPGGLRRAILSPLVGCLSVLMGIGGGSFGVPLMTLYAVPIHRAVATAAGFGAVIAVPSVAGFLLVTIPPESAPPGTVGAVNLPASAVAMVMAVLAAPLGARLAHAIEALLLRRIFAVFLILVAANMLRKVLAG